MPPLETEGQEPVKENQNLEVVQPDEVGTTETAAPEVIPGTTTEAAPGTGIDTDGDGTAEQVIAAPEEDAEPVHVDHEDDYKNKVKISDTIGDAVSKKSAIKLVKESQFTEHSKKEMLAEIKAGQFSPKYAEGFKKLKAADDNGSVYRPGNGEF